MRLVEFSKVRCVFVDLCCFFVLYNLIRFLGCCDLAVGSAQVGRV